MAKVLSTTVLETTFNFTTYLLFFSQPSKDVYENFSTSFKKLLRYLIKDTIAYSCRRSERFGVRMKITYCECCENSIWGLTRIIEVIDFTLSNRAIDRECFGKMQSKKF